MAGKLDRGLAEESRSCAGHTGKVVAWSGKMKYNKVSEKEAGPVLPFP